MKTAVYHTQNTTQVVLTPENDFEKDILSRFQEQSTVTVKHGSFYETRGDYFRMGSTEESLMLRVDSEPA